MTVLDIIRKSDELRPNVINKERKLEWITKLETELAEMVGMDVYDLDEDTELLMPDERCDVYVYHLCSMIDWANEETNLYMIDHDIFNQTLSDLKGYYRRNNRSFRWKGIRV